LLIWGLGVVIVMINPELAISFIKRD
jgi:hypothetical protein